MARSKVADGKAKVAERLPVRFGPLADWVGFNLRMAQESAFEAFSHLSREIGESPGRFATLTLIAQQVVKLEPELLGFKRATANQGGGINADYRRIGLGWAQTFAPANGAIVTNHFDQAMLPPFKAHRCALEGLV